MAKRYQSPSSKYPFVGPNYMKYGEVAGYVYNPWADNYTPSPDAVKDWKEKTGQPTGEKKNKSLVESLYPVAAAGLAYAGAREAGDYAGKKLPGLLGMGEATTTPGAGSATTTPNAANTPSGGATSAPASAPSAQPAAQPTGTVEATPSGNVEAAAIDAGAGPGVASAPNGGYFAADGTYVPAGYTTTDASMSSTDPSLAANAEGGTDYAGTLGAAAQGAAGAYQGYQGYQDWKEGNKTKGGLEMGAGATNVAASLGSETAASWAPYANVALGAYNTWDAYKGDGTKRERAFGVAHNAGMTAANAYTFGLAGLADAAAAHVFGKERAGIQNWMMKHSPVIGALAKVMGGKNDDQVRRDQVRKLLQKNGFLDDKYNVTLADGSKYDVGKDGSTKAYNIDFDKIPEAGDDIAMMSPLATIVSGGNKKIGSDFTGYFVNAINSSGNKYDNAKSLYKQAGIETVEQGLAVLDELRAADRIDDQQYEVYKAKLGLVLGDQPFPEVTEKGAMAIAARPGYTPPPAKVVPRPTPAAPAKAAEGGTVINIGR